MHKYRLNPDVIAYESADWCKRWWRACGKKVPTGTRVAALREQVLQWQKFLVDNPDKNLLIGTGTLISTDQPTRAFINEHIRL